MGYLLINLIINKVNNYLLSKNITDNFQIGYNIGLINNGGNYECSN